LNTWLEALQHFSNLVVIAKRIEKVIRIGKILDLNEKKGFTGWRKETEVHNVEGGCKGKKITYQYNYDFKKHMHLPLTYPI
jgi:hypothetical protein